MKRPLSAQKLPQPVPVNPNVLYEDEPAPAPSTAPAPEPGAKPVAPALITFSSYLHPYTMTRLYRWAYQNRLSVQDALNELIERTLVDEPGADAPMSEKAEAKLQEKLLKAKK